MQIQFSWLAMVLLGAQVQAAKPTAPDAIAGIITVTAEQAVELILATPDLVVIDSRRKEEYAKGHIDGAVNLLDDEMTEAMLGGTVSSELDTPLLFYCNGIHCLRSAKAATKAFAWGYRRIYWFRGGWLEWTEKAMPVAR